MAMNPVLNNDVERIEEAFTGESANDVTVLERVTRKLEQAVERGELGRDSAGAVSILRTILLNIPKRAAGKVAADAADAAEGTVAAYTRNRGAQAMSLDGGSNVADAAAIGGMVEKLREFVTRGSLDPTSGGKIIEGLELAAFMMEANARQATTDKTPNSNPYFDAGVTDDTKPAFRKKVDAATRQSMSLHADRPGDAKLRKQLAAADAAAEKRVDEFLQRRPRA